MAECHPVGFQWVVEAKARGAKVIHVDPRFTRTSALADLHVPIRAGSDIAFLGGIVHHILENRREFREYVVNYTNAPVIVDEAFADTEDLDVAMDMIADRVIATRAATWQDIDGDKIYRRTLGVASLGGATLDNEENYLIKKLFTALGAIQIENQARI